MPQWGPNWPSPPSRKVRPQISCLGRRSCWSPTRAHLSTMWCARLVSQAQWTNSSPTPHTQRQGLFLSGMECCSIKTWRVLCRRIRQNCHPQSSLALYSWRLYVSMRSSPHDCKSTQLGEGQTPEAPSLSWRLWEGPRTAFPNLILVQNEPPMVALWMPNAASESLEKKKFVSICLGHLGPEHLVPPQLFPI